MLPEELGAVIYWGFAGKEQSQIPPPGLLGSQNLPGASWSCLDPGAGAGRKIPAG